MIRSLTGENNYLVRKRLDELVSEFVNKHGDLALERLDGEEVDFPDVLQAISSLPFLAGRKMVVVRSLSFLKPSDKQLEQIISSISSTTDLILYEPLTDKRSSYFKFLKTRTQLEDYGLLDARGLAKWLVSESKTRGGSISLIDANFLVERVGPNQAMLASELDKLLLYNPNIHREAIELLAESTPQSKVFDLLDAAFSGDKSRALKLYDEQRMQKVEPQAILAMLAWQLRVLAVAVHAGKRDAAQVAQDSGMNIYPVNKAFGLARKINDVRLAELASDALDIDYRGKTSGLDMDEALKTYIVSI